MKKTSLIYLLAGAFLVLAIIGIYKCSTQPPESALSSSCQQQDTCNLPAPANLSANVEQLQTGGFILKISWDSVPGAKFYYVDVMDVTNDTFVYSKKKVFVDSVNLSFPTFNPKNNHIITVTCVCENCIASTNAVMFSLCPIVIEDIVMMECPHSEACDCTPGNDITPGGSGRTISFPSGTFRKLYRVEVTCGEIASRFPIEVERPGTAGIKVRVLNAGALNCPPGNIQNPPTNSGYPSNTVGNQTGRYSVSFTCNQMTFTIPDGCEWRILECTNCH